MVGWTQYGPSHMYGLGPAHPKKEEERSHWAEIGPTIFEPGSTHPFSGLSSASYLGQPSPHIL